MKKEVKDLLKQVEQQGWRIDDRGDRAVCFSPDGVTIVTIHYTPSDHRWKKNAAAQLRKGGFEG